MVPKKLKAESQQAICTIAKQELHSSDNLVNLAEQKIAFAKEDGERPASPFNYDTSEVQKDWWSGALLIGKDMQKFFATRIERYCHDGSSQAPESGESDHSDQQDSTGLPG